MCSDEQLVKAYTSSALENKGIRFKFFNSNLRDYDDLYLYADGFKSDLKNINCINTKSDYREKYKQYISRLEGIGFIERKEDASFVITKKCDLYLKTAKKYTKYEEKLFLTYLVCATGEFGIKNQLLVKTSDIISTLAKSCKEKTLLKWITEYDENKKPINNKLYWAFSFYDQSKFVSELENSSADEFALFVKQAKSIKQSIVKKRSKICSNTINTELLYFIVSYKLLSGLGNKTISTEIEFIEWMKLCWDDSFKNTPSINIDNIFGFLNKENAILFGMFYDSIQDLVFNPSSIHYCIENSSSGSVEVLKLTATEHKIELFNGNQHNFNPSTQEDYADEENKNKALGEAGEHEVYKYLCKIYSKENVHWISSYASNYLENSQTNDSAGYDIEVDTNQGQKFYEVKTTDKNEIRFYISTNEILSAQRKGKAYGFFVVKKDKNGKFRIMELHNIFEDFTFNIVGTTRGFIIRPLKWSVKLEIIG